MLRIGVVGLGAVAASHLSAWETFDGVDVVGGVDLAPGRMLRYQGRLRPVYAALPALLELPVEALVVATPTPSHSAVVNELLDHGGPWSILVEKPLTASVGEWRPLQERILGTSAPVWTLFHAAFAPEVTWAADRIGGLCEEHGPVQQADSSFTDAYTPGDPRARANYVSSWIDSGINALSVLARLVQLERLTSLRVENPGRDAWEARLAISSGGHEGEAGIRTAWGHPAGQKRTRLTFADAAVLTLDHRAMTVTLQVASDQATLYASSSPMPRLTQHYMGLWSQWLATRRFEGLPDALLHQLLLSGIPPASAP